MGDVLVELDVFLEVVEEVMADNDYLLTYVGLWKGVGKGGTHSGELGVGFHKAVGDCSELVVDVDLHLDLARIN